MTTLDLLGPDETTVLFAFDDPSGTLNPSGVRTTLGVGFNPGTSEPATTYGPRSPLGAVVTARSLPPVEMAVPFMASASSAANLRAGLGQLAAYLEDPPGPLRWTEGGVVRYLDLLGALNLPALVRGQGVGGLITDRLDSLGPIPLGLLRAYGMRGADVSVSGVTVPMDPATSTKGRIYPLTVSGDLPTTGRLRVQMDSGSAVRRLYVASRARRAEASTYFSDWLSDTGWLQCEATGRGWTITLGTDTSATTDASGSPGSGNTNASCTFTSSPTVPARRVRSTRTTKLDSMRGDHRVFARVKASAAGRFGVQLRWGPSTADPPAYALAEVIHDTSLNGTPGTFGWVELDLGVIHVPRDRSVSLGGMALELWARRLSGTGSLAFDTLWLAPIDREAWVTIPGASSETWLGEELVGGAGFTNPASYTNGTTSPGAPYSLNALTEACGAPPQGGIVWPAGRHRVTFAGTHGPFGGSSPEADVSFGVRNITDNNEGATATRNFSGAGTFTVSLEFDSIAAKAYQPQVRITGYVATFVVYVNTITHEFVPTLALNESARTGPDRGQIDRLDTSGNFAGLLEAAGPVPLVLEPGDNHVFVKAEDVPLALYEEGQQVLGRTPTVSVIYQPRYAL